MLGRPLLAAAICAVAMGACLVGPDPVERQYFCDADGQCADGFHCDLKKLVCVANGSSGGGAGGGGAAGGVGGGTAGGLGGGDGGGSAGGSGGGAAGGSGGGTAGGSGGGTAGGSGGGTAGGSDGGTAGGSGGGTAGGSGGGQDAGFDAGFDAGLPQGAICSQGVDCTNGRCVDGRCCNTTCTGVCDFCDLPSQPGQCGAGPLGRAPSIACAGGYACNGASVNCATTCSSDAGCVGARCGGGGVCIPKLSELKDNFGGTVFDAGTWSGVDSTCSITNEQFAVSTFANSTQYHSIDSRRRYDLLDSEVRFELVNPGNQSLNSLQAYVDVCTFPTSNRCLTVIATSGIVLVQLGSNNNYSSVIGYLPFPASHKLRMREDGGILYLESVGGDGGWQTFGTTATPFRNEFLDTTVSIGAGMYDLEDAGTTVIFDNLNSP